MKGPDSARNDLAVVRDFVCSQQSNRDQFIYHKANCIFLIIFNEKMNVIECMYIAIKFVMAVVCFCRWC